MAGSKKKTRKSRKLGTAIKRKITMMKRTNRKKKPRGKPNKKVGKNKSGASQKVSSGGNPQNKTRATTSKKKKGKHLDLLYSVGHNYLM